MTGLSLAIGSCEMCHGLLTIMSPCIGCNKCSVDPSGMKPSDTAGTNADG